MSVLLGSGSNFSGASLSRTWSFVGSQGLDGTIKEYAAVTVSHGTAPTTLLKRMGKKRTRGEGEKDVSLGL